MSSSGVNLLFYIVYCTINKVNGKKYIGKHITNDLDDSYLGSGLALKRALVKYGRENFTRSIIAHCQTEQEMNEVEISLITPEVVESQDYYNISTGGQGGCIVLYEGHPLRDKTIAKMRVSFAKSKPKRSEIAKKAASARWNKNT